MSTEPIACPVDKTMKLLNKKWSIEIIRDLFFGKKHFSDFKEGKPELSNKVLSNCLKNLEKNGLIEKRTIEQSPVTTEYNLTTFGKSLNKVIYELAMFTLKENTNNGYDSETEQILEKQFKETLNID